MRFGISLTVDVNRLIDQIQRYAAGRAKARKDKLIRQHRILCLHVTPSSWERLLSVVDFDQNALASHTKSESSKEFRAYYKVTGTFPKFHTDALQRYQTDLLKPCSDYLAPALFEVTDDEGSTILRCQYCKTELDTETDFEIMREPIGFVAPRLKNQYKAFCNVSKELGRAVSF